MHRNSLVEDYSVEQLEKVLAHGRTQFAAVQKTLDKADNPQLYLKGFTYGYLSCFYTNDCADHWDPHNLSRDYQTQQLLDPENLPLAINANYLEIIIKAATEHYLEALKDSKGLEGQNLFEQAFTDGYLTCIRAYDLKNRSLNSQNMTEIPVDVREMIEAMLECWDTLN